jgi:hypothetical protein
MFTSARSSTSKGKEGVAVYFNPPSPSVSWIRKLIESFAALADESADSVNFHFTDPETILGLLQEAVIPVGREDVMVALAPAAPEGIVTPCRGFAVTDRVAVPFRSIDRADCDNSTCMPFEGATSAVYLSEVVSPSPLAVTVNEYQFGGAVELGLRVSVEVPTPEDSFTLSLLHDALT